MVTAKTTHAFAATTTDSAGRAAAPDAVTVLAVRRAFAGTVSWIAPRTSWRLFGLRSLPAGGAEGLLTRLFGVRDLVLALGVRDRRPEVRRAALQAGLVADTADVLATVLAVRQGAPRTVLPGVAAGAALFVGLGAVGLRRPTTTPPATPVRPG